MKLIRQKTDLLNLIVLFIFFFGVVTIFWFFLCLIGLIIGIVYFLFLKNQYAKYNGLALAIHVGFISILTHTYKEVSPLNLAMWYGIGFIVIFLIFNIISFLNKKGKININSVKKISDKIILSKVNPSSKKSLKLLLILIPILMWSSVYIDFKVMFDNETKMLWINVPSTVKTGESFEITVEAWDSFERLSATYRGTIEFSLKSYDLDSFKLMKSIKAGFPQSYTFTGQVLGSDIAYEIKDGKDNGVHIFDAIIYTPGIHYILVNDSYTENTYYSNPVIVKNFRETDNRIFWGDIHTHSELSDGSGTAAHSFYYARHVACLDFYALTDHGEIMMWNPESLNLVEYEANMAYIPDEFVTFNGVEWTNVLTGHYTCIFSGDQLIKDPVLSYIILPTTDDLWKALDDFTEETGDRALALPHHTTQEAYMQDWTYINPKYVKIAEVTSVHGECLFEHRHELNYRGMIDQPKDYVYGTSVVDAFIMGKKMTMYASSDEHDGHPGHSLSHNKAYVGYQRPISVWHTRNEHPYPGGLTAAHVNGLTRDDVFTALEKQRIHANSDHGRPILEFSINGKKVGDDSTVKVSSADSPRRIEVFIAQDGAPVALHHEAASVYPDWIPNWKASVEIIKNGELWRSVDISSAIEKISVVDSEPIKGSSFEDKCVQIDGEWYVNEYSDNPIDPSTLNTNGYDFYLIRMVGENGRTSYIGPLWVEY